MGLSTEQLIASTNLMLDLHAIPGMAAEERAATRARYKAQVFALAAQEKAALEAFKQSAPKIPDRAACLALGRGARQHRAAQRALARIELAITQEAERALRIDGLTV